jgi:deoxyribonuclease-4
MLSLYPLIHMRFGFHISIAGGFFRVIERALKKNCQTMQFFSRNPRGWTYKALDADDVRRFTNRLHETSIAPVFVHMPYLPNLASPDQELYQRSIISLCEDLRRAQLLHARYLIVHVGHRGDSSVEASIERISTAINRAFIQVPNDIRLLLENTAGQGTELGHTFSQLQKIITGVTDRTRVGVCLDTAHAFAAGYDLSTQRGLEKTLVEFECCIGLEHLHLLHLNDSKMPLGSRADRHWHIGEGCIGRNGFRHIVNHPALRTIPGIMETPRKTDSEDLNNMRIIRSLAR